MPSSPHSHAKSALIIVGHGSTLNPDSSAPTLEHAQRLRDMGLFAEVACCFWKEEPNMREVHEMVQSQEVYIVPNFISEGYFCQEVLPRELGLSGPWTLRDGRRIAYCDPVGIHPSMTRLLLQRADEVAAGVPRHEISLVIVGHGTSLNENSTKAIKDQVRLIAEGGYGFAEVVDAYMEEPPLVSQWDELTRSPHVVVVPFFIADGLHSFQDIPVLLGMNEEPGEALSQMQVFRQNPIPLRGRQVYYSQAIGTEPLLAEVILEQVRAFDLRHGESRPPIPEMMEFTGDLLQQGLRRWLANGRNVLGQLRIRGYAAGGFVLHHAEDSPTAPGPEFDHPQQAREIARWDDAGQFRPLKSAPNLRRGWQLHLRDEASVLEALDIFYPAAIAMALRHEQGSLSPTPLRTLLARQTGMYKFTNSIGDQACNEVVAKCCSNSKCLRRIVYPLAPGQAFGAPADEKTSALAGVLPSHPEAIPLLCMEACSHILSATRLRAKKDFEARNAATQAPKE
jgi:sirohydrochlorin cobaltochelatase